MSALSASGRVMSSRLRETLVKKYPGHTGRDARTAFDPSFDAIEYRMLIGSSSIFGSETVPSITDHATILSEL